MLGGVSWASVLKSYGTGESINEKREKGENKKIGNNEEDTPLFFLSGIKKEGKSCSATHAPFASPAIRIFNVGPCFVLQCFCFFFYPLFVPRLVCCFPFFSFRFCCCCRLLSIREFQQSVFVYMKTRAKEVVVE